MSLSYAKGRLDQSGYASGSFRVTKVGFHRTHAAGLPLRTPFAKHGAESPKFNRISLASSRTVSLDVLGSRWVNACLGKGRAHAGDLGPSIGSNHAIAAAIRIDS